VSVHHVLLEMREIRERDVNNGIRDVNNGIRDAHSTTDLATAA